MQIKTIVTQFQTNTYVILGDKTIVVDPGGNTQELISFLEGLKRKPDYVIVTHGHYDHVYSCAELEKLGAKIFMSKKDDYLVAGGGHLKHMGITIYPFEYEDVFEGQILTLGNFEFRVIETPGHTPGGVSYICDEYIFSGDTLFRKTIGRTDFPGGDMDVMRMSLTRFLNLDTDYILLPGHGPSTTVESEKSMIRRLIGE